MTISRTQLVLLGIAAVLILVIGIMAGRGCTPTPAPPSTVVTGIDAGPGDRVIDQHLDAALVLDEQHMQQIEGKFSDDIAAFDDQQRAQYQQLRSQDLEAAAQSLSEWNRRRRADAGAMP